MKYLIIILLLLAPVSTSAQTVVDISDAIAWLLRTNPRHPLMRDARARRAMAKDINQASAEYNQDQLLITGMAFYESTFRPGARGRLGEIGLLQVGPHVREECKSDGWPMSDPLHQLRCGARHLRRQIDRCGSLAGGLASYASSRCRALPGTRVSAAVNIRLWMARKLAKRPWRKNAERKTMVR